MKSPANLVRMIYWAGFSRAFVLGSEVIDLKEKEVKRHQKKTN
jgi:hypothetical protein